MPRDLTARYQRQLMLVANMEVWASFPTKQKKFKYIIVAPKN